METSNRLFENIYWNQNRAQTTEGTIKEKLVWNTKENLFASLKISRKNHTKKCLQFSEILRTRNQETSKFLSCWCGSVFVTVNVCRQHDAAAVRCSLQLLSADSLMLLQFAVRYSYCLQTAWCSCCSLFVTVTVCRQHDTAAVRCSLQSLSADSMMQLLFAVRYSYCLQTAWCCCSSLLVTVSVCRQPYAAAVRCSLQKLSADSMVLFLLFDVRYSHCLQKAWCSYCSLFVRVTVCSQPEVAAVRCSLESWSADCLTLLLLAVR